jgi:Flp pilus assembly pilin Flp
MNNAETEEGKSMNTNSVRQKKSEKRQRGVTTVEYAIMLVLIAIAVAIASPAISSAVVSVFGKTSSVLNN